VSVKGRGQFATPDFPKVGRERAKKAKIRQSVFIRCRARENKSPTLRRGGEQKRPIGGDEEWRLQQRRFGSPAIGSSAPRTGGADEEVARARQKSRSYELAGQPCARAFFSDAKEIENPEGTGLPVASCRWAQQIKSYGS
jgi:hypothetical protein